MAKLVLKRAPKTLVLKTKAPKPTLQMKPAKSQPMTKAYSKYA